MRGIHTLTGRAGATAGDDDTGHLAVQLARALGAARVVAAAGRVNPKYAGLPLEEITKAIDLVAKRPV